MIAENEAVMAALLSNIEASIRQMQKSVASTVTRNFVLAISILSNISHSSKAVIILAKPPLRIAKKMNSSGQSSQATAPRDIFTTLLDVVECLKLATAMPQSGIFLSVVNTFRRAAANENARRKLVARKKWMEKLDTITKGIRADGEKKSVARGGGNGKAELMKASALEGVMAILQG